jgi:hypothetical protein
MMALVANTAVNAITTTAIAAAVDHHRHFRLIPMDSHDKLMPRHSQ